MKIALTGGIGSGKSTVAGLWVACGAELFDADAVSRELTAAGGAAMPALVQFFGEACRTPEGALDRAWMRERAFQDPAARRRLEGVLHPMIAQRARLAQASTPAGLPLVLDIPLLAAGSAWRQLADRVLVVDCSAATQIERVRARSGLAAEEVQRIIDSQIDRPARRALADAVIFNDGLTVADLKAQVQALWGHWMAQGIEAQEVAAPSV